MFKVNNLIGFGGGAVAGAGPAAGGGGDAALLDDRTAPAVAFSTRLLLTAYSGPVIKLRRDSDDATDDFTADVDGNLANGSAQDPDTWGGGAGLFVDTWYDQSGNGVDVVQATAGAQPAFNPTDTVFNNRASMFFNNSTSRLASASTPTLWNGAGGMACLTLAAPTTHDQVGGMVSMHAAGNTGPWWQGLSDVGAAGSVDDIIVTTGGSRSDYEPAWPAAAGGASELIEMTYDGADIRAYLNQTELGSGMAKTGNLNNASSALTLGHYTTSGGSPGLSGYYYQGDLAEVIAWAVDLDDGERATIGADMMTAYLP